MIFEHDERLAFRSDVFLGDDIDHSAKLGENSIECLCQRLQFDPLLQILHVNSAGPVSLLPHVACRGCNDTHVDMDKSAAIMRSSCDCLRSVSHRRYVKLDAKPVAGADGLVVEGFTTASSRRKALVAVLQKVLSTKYFVQSQVLAPLLEALAPNRAQIHCATKSAGTVADQLVLSCTYPYDYFISWDLCANGATAACRRQGANGEVRQ